MNEPKHWCFRAVLIYKPNPAGPDRVTVGFVLFEADGENRRVAVRFVPDTGAILAFVPTIDIETLEGTLLDWEPALVTMAGSVVDFPQKPWLVPETFPAHLEVLAPVSILTDNFDNELERQSQQLFSPWAQILLDKPERTRQSQHGLVYLRKETRNRFIEHQVWDHLEKQIRVDRFTLKEDDFTIMCAYRSASNNVYRMFDPVSLVTLKRAEQLALRWRSIQEGLHKETGSDCEMHAIVEDDVKQNEGEAKLGLERLSDAGVRVERLSAMPMLAARARNELRL